jgi:hypothetical protein
MDFLMGPEMAGVEVNFAQEKQWEAVWLMRIKLGRQMRDGNKKLSSAWRSAVADR